MLSPTTLKCSCPQNCKFDYFFHKFLQMGLLRIFLFESLTETGKAACGFACINSLFSKVEMGFSLYPFPLELGLSVLTPNMIS